MPDEFDLDNLDSTIEKENRVEKRIKDLSEKVKLAAEERDDQKRLLQEKLSENENLVKERDFLNAFGDTLAKYPEAAGLKDKIKERVLKGYSVEDATAATLVAEGKYNPPKIEVAPKEAPLESIVGGSSPTMHQAGGEKTLQQLSREEKRAKLVEAEQRGDISVT